MKNYLPADEQRLMFFNDLQRFIWACMFDLHSRQPEICHRTCQVRVWKAYYVCKQSRQTYDFIHAILHTALLPWPTLYLKWTSPRAVVLKTGLLCWSLLKVIAWQWQENIEIFERFECLRFEKFRGLAIRWVLIVDKCKNCGQWLRQLYYLLVYYWKYDTNPGIYEVSNCMKDLFLPNSFHQQRNKGPEFWKGTVIFMRRLLSWWLSNTQDAVRNVVAHSSFPQTATS